MTNQELKEYNARRRKQKIESQLMVLSKFEQGADINLINDFISETMDYYIMENMDNFTREKKINFSISKRTISGNFSLHLNLRGTDEFTKVFNKCIFISVINLAEDRYEKKLQRIKDLDINNKKDRAFLKQWAEDHYELAMSINNELLEDKAKQEEDNNLLVLHKSEERTIVVDYTLFQSGVDFSEKVLDIWFETCGDD